MVRPGRSELSSVGDRGRLTVRSEVTEAAGGSFAQARGEAEAGLTRPPSVRRGEGIAAGDISRVLRLV
jgi:hypothetical protein